MPSLACVDANPPVSPIYALRDTGALPAPEAALMVASGGAPPPATEAAVANDFDRPWSVDRSAELYSIHAWGAPYFSINNAGNISVRPHGSNSLPHQEIDLMKVVKKASDLKVSGGLGLQLPLIVRFPDILKNRLQSLQSAFDFAIRSSCYNSHYQGVYPVKCNQDRYIVEDIVDFGLPFLFGLEVGSKPELLLAMSCLSRAHIAPGAFLICNGYKDDEYVSLALIARKLDLNAIIVLEQVEELDTIIEASRRLGIHPVIGLRAKLRTKHDGHFGSTSGEKGKFGLTTLQILSVVAKLRKLDLMDCLQLLHFHIGSQIPSIDLLADGVSEAAQIYCELVRMGAAMKVFDIGGGLGIDYDGTRSSGSDMSVGYSLDEYASAVVRTVMYVCDRKCISHPVICSESGRALVSHHSVLVFEATSSSSMMASAKSALQSVDLAFLTEGLAEEAHFEYRSLMAAAIRGDCKGCLSHADRLKWRCVERFKDGTLDLELLAAVDSLCDLVSRTMCAYEPVKTYHVNLSMFTSVPDFWGIGQLFPVTPIHRLDECPCVKGVLSDITCDSDGKMDTFIGGKSSLPLHDVGGGSSYYLGMFLGGAYQEALGGLHNLFGGPSVVRVLQSDGAHCFAVTRAVPGPSSADVLRMMQHEPEIMFEILKERAYDCAVARGGGDALSELAHAFNSMPYLVPRLDADERCQEVVVDEERHYYTSGGDDSADGSTCDDLEWDLRRCMLDRG